MALQGAHQGAQKSTMTHSVSLTVSLNSLSLMFLTSPMGFTELTVGKAHYRRLRPFFWSANMASLFKWRPLELHEG